MDKGWGQESMGQGSRNKHASVTACDNFIVSDIKSVVQQMKIIIIWGKKKKSPQRAWLHHCVQAYLPG